METMLNENSSEQEELDFLVEVKVLTETAPRLSKLFTEKMVDWVRVSINTESDPDLFSELEKTVMDYSTEHESVEILTADLQIANNNLAVAETENASLLARLTTATQEKSDLEAGKIALEKANVKLQTDQDVLYLLNNNLKAEIAERDITIQRLNKTIDDLRNGKGDQFTDAQISQIIKTLKATGQI